MVMTGAVEGTRDAKALQNLLICMEMVAGAFAMSYAYTNKVRGSRQPRARTGRGPIGPRLRGRGGVPQRPIDMRYAGLRH